jgi:hypothetical protein
MPQLCIVILKQPSIMDRKDFLKKGLMGTGMFITSAAIGDTLNNDIDEIKPLEPIGYNHLPNESALILENTVLHKAETRGHTTLLALPIIITLTGCTLAYSGY